MRRFWKWWKPKRRKKALASLDFHARELLLLPLRGRPDWPLGRLAPIEGTPPASGARLVAFIGCDPLYLAEHGLPLVRSIERSSPDTAVHLHLYHPGAREHALVAGLRSELRLPLSATWEACRLEGSSARRRSTYYETVRFVRLAQLLEQIAVPIVSIDADTHVRAPLCGLLDATDGADVGLVFEPIRADSGRNLLAAAVLARPTAAARVYFRDVARRIARQMLLEPHAGFLDQRCLWFAYKKLGARVRFAAIPAGFVDASMADASGVWHAKGDRDGDPRFRREREALRASP